MTSRWLANLLGAALLAASPLAADARAQIQYANRSPAGLVGNGRSVVEVRPDGYQFHTGGEGDGRFRLVVDGLPYELTAAASQTTFFPGGVVYALRLAGMRVEVLHGALPAVPYLAVIRVTGAHGKVELEIEAHGAPILTPRGFGGPQGPPLTPDGRLPVRLVRGAGEVVLAAGAAAPAGSAAELRRQIEAPYGRGLVLETPTWRIDRAVPFCSALLDLGFDGRLHVCELFRWRDIWSRDLGSGLAPGAMASGRFAAARATIAYDLRRYAAADPRGLKVTQDPSQGGTAEGTAWLARAVWREYLLTGDAEFLRDAARTLRPWVAAWLDRDADEGGLLVDVSEWMDHSRFFLFPDGARVLYSNVLFADLLRTFARIETALGDHAAAQRAAALQQRFVRGINETFWDEAAGAYDNLVLWGRPDQRIAAAENALAVLSGVATEARARRALATVRARSWRPAGSVTIVPPMTHVDEHNDHNYKVWPWWNAVEARARFRIGDVEGGMHLLERSAATLEDEHFPGLIEELLTPEGVSEGGHAFVTAAGAYLDAVVEGLLGVEILEPGCARLRVSPNVPASWPRWRARVPLPHGELEIIGARGHLRIRVTDPRVQVIEAPARATVEGATRAALTPLEYPDLTSVAAPPAAALPAPRPRRAAVFFARGVPTAAADDLPGPRVAAEDLLHLDPAEVGALIVAGNALPRRTAGGEDVQAALARYLDRGGALVFYGATMQDRGTMGEHGGVIEWYERRPVVQATPLGGWRFRISSDGVRIAHEDERGLRDGWHRADLDDSGWEEIQVPAAWEAHLGRDYDGWAWYRAHFALPATARGAAVVLDLGRVDDSDWTYVNGELVGTQDDAQAIRHYRIAPGDPAYSSLVFGGNNVVAVQVLDTGGAGGLVLDTPRIGVETADLAWAPIDPKSGLVADRPVRHGVVSWGPGGAFFNSWETSRGAFGFRVEGHGVEFVGPLAGLAPLAGDVGEAFTDFAVSRPWRFEPLAFTETRRHLLVPDHGERYPCMARLVDTATGGEIYLIPAAVSRTPGGLDVLRRLRIGVGE